MSAVSDSYKNALKHIQTNISDWIDCLPSDDRTELLTKRNLSEDSKVYLENFKANNGALLKILSKKIQNSKTNVAYQGELIDGRRSKDPKTKVAALVLGFIVPPVNEQKKCQKLFADIMTSIEEEFTVPNQQLKPKDVADGLRDGSIHIASTDGKNIQQEKGPSSAFILMQTLATNNKKGIKALREGCQNSPEFRMQFNKCIDELLKSEKTKPEAYIVDHLVEGGAYVDAFISCSIM